MRGAASLLRGAHDGPELDALALPLARALLHLPNQYELDGFTEARHGALLPVRVRVRGRGKVRDLSLTLP